MASFSDLSTRGQVGVIVGAALAVTAVLYFLLFKGMQEENRQSADSLALKRAEIAQLEAYRPRLADLNSQIELLKQQLERQKLIVPDEKEADRFMHLMQDIAAASGVEIRRYTAQPVATREFYTEVPFEMDLDGPYYGVLSFFNRVARLERIVNISNLKMAAVTRTEGGIVRRRYDFSPRQTVVVGVTATTFFSNDLLGTPGAAGAGAAAAAPAK